MHDFGIVKAFREPRSAGVPPASCGGVSPPARTPGGTPGELAGVDACVTSAGQFMIPMHAKKRKRALHEARLSTSRDDRPRLSAMSITESPAEQSFSLT